VLAREEAQIEDEERDLLEADRGLVEDLE